MPNYALILEDNLDLRELTADVLQLEGFMPQIAGDVETALRLLQTLPHAPVVALCDINVPGNGLVFIARLREQSETPYIIAMSGQPDLEAEALAAGADIFLLKPYPLEALLELLQGRAGA